MAKYRKIYSLNLICFITYETDLKPQLFCAEDEAVYAVFPEVRGVAYAIKKWRDGNPKVDIHEYLNEFALLRERIKQLRGE